MSTACDSTTIDILRSIIGRHIKKVAVRRYPGYLAYSQAIVMFFDGLSLRIDLADEVIAPKFEVFVIRVRVIEPPLEWAEWDSLELGNFVVGEVFTLRRREWIDKITMPTGEFVGQHPVIQRFGSIDDISEAFPAVTVDSGLCLVSTSGAEVSFDADTFPLTMQFVYKVSASPLPSGSRTRTGTAKDLTGNIS